MSHNNAYSLNYKYLNRMRLPISMRLPHAAQRRMHPHTFGTY
jgi:hypothetical protein